MFVDVEKLKSGMQFEILYATKNNFMGQAVYTQPRCFLHRDVAKALLNVQKEAQKLSLCLKVYDGYRPLSVQQLMWNRVQDERYVSNPAVNKGRHTRGTAVDVTLLDAQGRELEMPTGFDDFTEKAHAEAPCNPNAHRNRALLKQLMKDQGFEMITTEWWHFDYLGWHDDEKYPAMNISFEELSTLEMGHI